MMRRSLSAAPLAPVAAACALLLALLPGRAVAQSADNVLVVINQASTQSIQVGGEYVQRRTIPTDHIVRISVPTSETIQRAAYESLIETPIASWLSQHGLQDRILYIVLTKGVPLRIAGTSGTEGTTASVDSELTLLYRKMLGDQPRLMGKLPNPYYLGSAPITDAKPFTRFTSDIYLVTRLDGFTVQDIRGLIERGAQPSQIGKIVLDQKDRLIDAGGDHWLRQAAERLTTTQMGDRVVLESSSALAATDQPVLGYSSWGSNDPANRLRQFGFRFSNGALAALFVSTDGRTFVEPPAAWSPSNPNSTAQTGQTLAGDLIRDGITGVSAHVSEPYLDATIRPQVLFPAYLGGFNLAESYYLAMPYLSWQTMIVGDPLCAPFRTKVLAATDIDNGVDEETDLPALFSARRVALFAKTGANPEALKLSFKAEVARQRDPSADVTALLLRATELDPRLPGAQLQLAITYDAREQHDQAVDRYRKVLAIDPTNLVALNNLAYTLAVHKNNPVDALSLAETAFLSSNEAPLIADTLGWIHHLLNEDRTAVSLIEQAARALPDNVDVLLHAAVVHATLGDVARASQELDAAIKLDDTVRNRPEAEQARAALLHVARN